METTASAYSAARPSSWQPAPEAAAPVAVPADVSVCGSGLTAIPTTPAGEDPVRALRERLVVSALLATPVVAMAMAPALQFDYWQWLSLTLTAPVAVWGAAPIHRGAWASLRSGIATADTLVSIGTLTAFGWSLYTLFLGDAGMVDMRHGLSLRPQPGMAQGQMYLEVAATVPVFVLAGRYAEARAQQRYGTGAACSPGTRSGGRAQQMADRLAAVFVPFVVTLAAGTFGFWLSAGDLTAAFPAAVAVLVISCPCALGLATPTAFMLGASKGAQLGIALAGPDTIERTRRLDTILLTDIGAIATSATTLIDVATSPGTDVDDALWLTASLAEASQDPAFAAIAASARERGLVPAPIEILTTSPGVGLGGVIHGHTVATGRARFLAAWSLHPPTELAAFIDDAESAGYCTVLTAWDGAVRAVFVLAGTVKPSARSAVEHLSALGQETVLVTPLPHAVAADAATRTGIDHVIGDLPRQETVAVLQRFRDEGRTVAVMADPADGADALAAADASLAVAGNGTAAPSQPVDLTMASRDLWAVVDALRLCRRIRRVAGTNLFWAFTYNLAALPVAAAGLLNPMVAGAAMTLSTIFVLANSQRLRRFRPLRPPAHQQHRR